MIVRHILPGAGMMPADLATDGMSGLVGVAYNVARYQAMQGWQVELIGLARPGRQTHAGAWPEGLRMTAVRPWRWCQVGNYDFRYHAPVAARLLMRPKADFHHVYSNPYLLALGRAAKRILHYTTTIEQVPRAYQKAAQRADAVICCSVFIRDQFLHHVPYPAARVFAIPPGVDMDHYHPGDRQASRAALGIPVDETVVLFAGAVHEDKGLIHLVRAMKLLSDTAKLRLLVAGSSSLWGHVGSRDGAGGAEVSAYEQKVAEEAKGVTATFLGKVPYAKMPVVHRAADIFVCPSVWDDPFPLVSLEAMATALPVIGTRKGGIPEAIVEGVNGLLVPPADAEALASALRTLVDSPLLRQEMGQAGLRRVQGFGWQAITAQVQEVYDQVRTGPDRDAASP